MLFRTVGVIELSNRTSVSCRYLLSLFITPRVRGILLAIFEVCALQLINSFIVSPRKLNVVTFSIFVSQIIKSGISFAFDNLLVIKEYHEFVFWTFRDSLLTASQSEILRNSKFIKAVTRPMSSLPPWVNEHKGLL